MKAIGLHVSAAGGLFNAPKNARELGCECFQFFSRSPRGGKTHPILAADADEFRRLAAEYGMRAYIHAPYFINFASSEKRISFGSVSAIREELERGSRLGALYVITHLGSRKDLGEKEAIKQTIERIKGIYADAPEYGTKLLLENSAGAANVVGDKLEELAEIRDGVGRKDIGICLDTCHLYASGYDVSSSEGLLELRKTVSRLFPKGALKLVHANDSKFTLGGKKDRHADIGDGFIGREGFAKIAKEELFKDVDFVLETPGEDARRKKDVALMKKMRG